VWTHSQGVFPLRKDLAKVLRIKEESLRLSHVEGPGCYGHNGADDVALDACLLARAVPGKPLKVLWSRSDEFAWEPFGTAMEVRLRACLDADGRVSVWRSDVWTGSHATRPGIGKKDETSLIASHAIEQSLKREPVFDPGGGERNALPLYAFEALEIKKHLILEPPLRVSALRSLGAMANVFAIESFMDMLALEAQKDPVAFRIEHLKDERAVALILRLAKAVKWSHPGRKTGLGVGFLLPGIRTRPLTLPWSYGYRSTKKRGKSAFKGSLRGLTLGLQSTQAASGTKPRAALSKRSAWRLKSVCALRRTGFNLSIGKHTRSLASKRAQRSVCSYGESPKRLPWALVRHSWGRRLPLWPMRCSMLPGFGRFACRLEPTQTPLGCSVFSYPPLRQEDGLLSQADGMGSLRRIFLYFIGQTFPSFTRLFILRPFESFLGLKVNLGCVQILQDSLVVKLHKTHMFSKSFDQAFQRLFRPKRS